MTVANFMTTILRSKINLNSEMFVLRGANDNDCKNFDIEIGDNGLYLVARDNDEEEDEK